MVYHPLPDNALNYLYIGKPALHRNSGRRYLDGSRSRSAPAWPVLVSPPFTSTRSKRLLPGEWTNPAAAWLLRSSFCPRTNSPSPERVITSSMSHSTPPPITPEERFATIVETLLHPAPTTTRLRKAPMSMAMGAPQRPDSQPISRYPSGRLPSKKSTCTLMTRPLRWSGVTVWSVVMACVAKAVSVKRVHLAKPEKTKIALA